jgi:hypothetical protein
MRQPGRGRPDEDRRSQVVEIVCVVLVIVAVAALVAWFLVHHGGGVLNQGAVTAP